MHGLVLASLLALAILAIGGAILDAVAARKRALRARLKELGASEPGPEGQRGRMPLLGGLARIGRLLMPGGASRTLEDQLAQAGYYGKSAAAVFIAAKVILLLTGFAASAFLLLQTEVRLRDQVLWSAAIGSVMFFLPNMALRLQRAKRQLVVWGHLPYAIDLLEICVSSGMGLDMAWNVVAEEMRGVGDALANEMALTDLEIHLGASRLEATKHMADRTGVREVSSFAAMLVQSERFGTSIADALRNFAASMREERSLKAEEQAEKTAVKLIFPMVALMFPALLLVLIGPGVMKVLEVLK